MRYFPMFLKMAGRKVVIVGGGEAAARKTRLALKTEAEIVVAAPAVDAELQDLARRGRVRHASEALSVLTFRNAALVFVATGCAGADAAAADLARTAGAVVNVVDHAELSDAITPAIVDRDPVVVAIGTEGTAPVLTREIKTRVEAMLEPRLGELAALAGRLRGAALALPPAARRGLWRWVFDGPARQAHAEGRERAAADMVKAALAAGGAPDAAAAASGHVSLVGAGPGARDLMTLRAVKRLQEAAVIFYDRLLDPEALELARRDAERIYVGKTPGAAAWPQDRINGLLVAAARQGRRVVRLKCGDPGVFGRGAEEAAALRDAGVAFEVVPGVTAAAAATAAMGGFLTERGETDTVVLTTGRARDGDADPAWAAHLRPGVTMAVYMGVASAARVKAALLAAGHDPALPTEIVTAAGAPDARSWRTTLGALAATVAGERIPNPAIILVRSPKTAKPAAARAAA